MDEMQALLAAHNARLAGIKAAAGGGNGQGGGSGNAARGALHLVKNSLNGGEMDPGMGARFDQPRWQSGCSTLLNMVPLPCGGITKRPGFEHMGDAATSGQACRLLPFIFSAGEARMLEIYQVGSGSGLRVWLPDGRLISTSCKLPFARNEIYSARFCQCGDVIYCAHACHAPGKIMRYGDDDWRYETIRFTPGIAAPVIESAMIMGWWGNGYQGAFESYTYKATAIDAETGEESAASAEVTVNMVPPLSDDFFMSITVGLVPGASEYRLYRKSAGIFGFIGRLIPKEDGTLDAFEDKGIVPDTADTPPENRNPFDGEYKYPSIVFMHQQRLGFASSDLKPLTVWLSQSGNFESMAASQPPDDDDAIEATLAARQANRILWAVSDRSGLVIGTEGGEWVLKASEGAALTPKDLNFEPQTYYGSQEGLEPLRAADSVLFCQRGGIAARELGYSFQSDKYMGTDLSLLARHILRGRGIKSWCWQPEPYGIVWCALADGTLAGLTYLREHEVVAWHRHETDGFVEWLESMPGPDGEWQVWALVRRTGAKGGETRRVERLAGFFHGGFKSDAVHVDGLEKKEFAARCIPCLAEQTLENGSSFLLVKKINAVKARVVNSCQFTARCLGRNMAPSPVMSVPARPLGYVEADDWACPLGGGFRDGAKLELIFDGPDPVTILGLTVTLELAGEAGAQI